VSSESVEKSTLSGIRWLALKGVMGEGLALTTAVVLARLVSPAGFGHAAVALMFIPLATIVTFEGFASALVQRESVLDSHRRVAALLSLGGGAVLSATLLASVPLVWRPIFGQETATLVALASPVFLIAGIGTVSRATLWRRLDFRLMTIIDLVSSAAGNVIAVTLAVVGLGAKAIVTGAVAGTAVGALCLIWVSPEPLPRWHGRSAHEIGQFGLFAALGGLVSALSENVDYWILAARLSPYQVGIYYRAFNLGVVYQSKLSNVMMQLAFPVYSRLTDRKQMRDLHERAARIHAAVIFPLLALLIPLAPIVIPFVFGSAWAGAVVPAQILAGGGMMAAVLTGYAQVMLAVGRPRILLQFNVATLVIYATAVALAAGHGLVVVSITVVAVELVILLAAYRFLLGPQLGITVARLIPGLGPAVTGCVALLAVTVPLRVILEPQLPRSLTIGVIGLVGACVYALVLRSAFRPTWDDLVTLVIRVFPPLARFQRHRTGSASAPA
jgi:O-antigen/teichoic acid export membrane protein